MKAIRTKEVNENSHSDEGEGGKEYCVNAN